MKRETQEENQDKDNAEDGTSGSGEDNKTKGKGE